MKKVEDFSQIAYVMSNMVKSLLSGKEIPKRKVKVEIDVWEPIAEVIDTIAKEMEVPQQEVFNQLVQEGLNMRLQSGLQEAQTEVRPEPDADVKAASEGLGLNLEGLTKGLTDLQNLATQLQGMQKMFEGVNEPTINIPKNRNPYPPVGKKDSK